MSNSIKQLINLLASFIDKTFIPLIDNKTAQAIKAMDQWSQLKHFLYESDQIQTWRVQKFIIDMPLRPVNIELRKATSDQPDKLNPSPNMNVNLRTGSYLQTDQWKYRLNESAPFFQPEKKQNYTMAIYSSINNNNANCSNNNQLHKPQERSEVKTNIESFENLLSSFRKLCTNFQNNHKKLVMDRQAFLH